MPNFLINVFSKGTKKTSNEIKGLTGNVNSLASAAKKAAVVFGVGFLGKQIFDIGKGAIKTAAQFELLRVRLNTMYGSVQKGTKAFDAFNKVAAKTPFQLQDVVDAGATLKAFGMDAENTIKPLADVAAFMQVDMSTAAANMGRAFVSGAGAADMFRDKGLLPLIAVTAGVADATKLPLAEFREAMFKTFADPEAGIMGMTTKMANTWSGAVSNFQDGVDRLKGVIGDVLIKALKPKLDEINDLLSEFGDIGWDNIGSAFASNLELFTDYAARITKLSGEIIGRSLMQGIFTTMATSGPTLQRAIADMLSFIPGLAGMIDMFALGTEKLGQSFLESSDQTELLNTLWVDLQKTMGFMVENWIILAETQKRAREEGKEGGKNTVEIIEKELTLVQRMGDAWSSFYKRKRVENKKTGKMENVLTQQELANYAKVSGGAQQAMSAVVKAETMEAMSGIIASIFKTVAYPFNIILAAGAGGVVSGIMDRTLGSIKEFAQGGDFVTSGPQLMMVGDNAGGRERVQVTPLSSPNIDGPSGSSVTVNVSGNVLSQDFVEGELAENIKEAVRRGTDFGIS